jgi:hypothetical protein
MNRVGACWLATDAARFIEMLNGRITLLVHKEFDYLVQNGKGVIADS